MEKKSDEIVWSNNLYKYDPRDTLRIEIRKI